MEDKLVSYETAVLAREKKFNGLCQYYWGPDFVGDEITQFNYWEGSELNGFSRYDNPELIEDSLLLPAQSLLAKWLREKHNIIVYAKHYKDNWYEWVIQSYEDIDGERIWNKDISSDINSTSFEKALENGLYQGLLLIK